MDLKRLPVPEAPHVDVISEKDQVRLLKAAKPWVRYLLWLAMKTGMRRGEIVNLRWGAIHFDKSGGGFLFVEASEGFHTKSKRSRRLRLTSQMSDLFINLLKEAKERGKAGPNDFIFVTIAERPILPDRLTREARKVMKKVLGRKNGAVHILAPLSLNSDTSKRSGHRNGS